MRVDRAHSVKVAHKWHKHFYHTYLHFWKYKHVPAGFHFLLKQQKNSKADDIHDTYEAPNIFDVRKDTIRSTLMAQNLDWWTKGQTHIDKGTHKNAQTHHSLCRSIITHLGTALAWLREKGWQTRLLFLSLRLPRASFSLSLGVRREGSKALGMFFGGPLMNLRRPNDEKIRIHPDTIKAYDIERTPTHRHSWNHNTFWTICSLHLTHTLRSIFSVLFMTSSSYTI